MNNHAIRTIFPAKSNLFTWLSTEDGDGIFYGFGFPQATGAALG